MNRVAVITDIHANMAALEATLAELEALSVDAVYSAATSSDTGLIRARSAR
jgi:hypothetical protein